VIAYGLQDGVNEQNLYVNNTYRPVNDPLVPTSSGNPDIIDFNRWQSLSLASFIDKPGNTLPESAPGLLGAEWRRVAPFALAAVDRTIYQRSGYDYWVYHDPGAPPAIDVGTGEVIR